MEEKPVAAVIRCTPDNLRQVRAAISRWPELQALIADLQAHDLFPGLRATRFCIYGAPDVVDKGLEAIGRDIPTTGASDATEAVPCP